MINFFRVTPVISALFFYSPLVSAEVLPLTERFIQAEAGEQFPGGETSQKKKRSKRSFLQPAANLAFEKKLDYRIGESVFAKLWVFSPSSTTASDGLGPLYNARSCMGCHIKGGRGHVPAANWPEDNAISMLMRLSIPAQTEEEKRRLASGEIPFIAEPTYGAQLQDFAVPGLTAEGRINIDYTERVLKLNDVEQVSLRTPKYSITDLGYGQLHPQTLFSPRIANPMIGLGLLEAIAEQDILSLEDPSDENNDGISGRANKVWDASKKSVVLGRFGWKAGAPSLNQQNSAAFATDMGLSTNLFSQKFSGDCTLYQKQCLSLPDGRSTHLGDVEAAPQMTQMLLLFTRSISVPMRVDVNDTTVLAGKKHFYQSGCVDCHRPQFKTSSEAPAGLDNQIIWPFTDLLLHDMGAGLADNRPEFKANGREWRTPPLWGIGATSQVSEKTEYLHDGRARSLIEAVLWHGGEAEKSKNKVVEMSKKERKELITFLESL